MQVIRQLSNDLASYVLKAAPVTIDHLLQVLPEDLHPLAVHARYPSILSTSTLSIDCSEHSFSTLATLLRTRSATPTTVQQLSMRNIDSDALTQDASESFGQALRAVCSTAMHASLSILSRLESPAAETEGAMTGLISRITSNTALRSLDIAAPRWVLRHACFKSLSEICSLALVDTAADSKAVAADPIPPCTICSFSLSSLTKLTRLRLGRHARDSEAMRNVFDSLQQLQCIELSQIHNEGDVKWRSFLQACTGLSQLTSLIVADDGAANFQHTANSSASLATLAALHNLRMSDLSGVLSVADSQVEGLAEALRQLKCLEHLILNLCLEDVHATILQRVVKALQEAGTAGSCSKLVLTCATHVGYSAEMCEALQCLSSLQNLSVPMERVISWGNSPQLVLSSTLCPLTALQLTQDGAIYPLEIGHPITPFLMGVLPHLTNLQHLAIHKYLHNSSEYQALASALAALSSLQRLEVTCKPRATHVSCVTTQVLPQLTAMTCLKIGYSPALFRPASPHIMHGIFGRCMSSLVQLHTLEVDDSLVSESTANEFAVGLASCLPRFTSLKRFSLRCRFSNAELEAVLAGMQGLTQLQHLRVFASMQPGSVVAATQVLTNMHDLREVSLHPTDRGLEVLDAVSRLTRLTCLEMPLLHRFERDSAEGRVIADYLKPLQKLRHMSLGSGRGIAWISGE